MTDTQGEQHGVGGKKGVTPIQCRDGREALISLDKGTTSAAGRGKERGKCWPRRPSARARPSELREQTLLSL